MTVEFVKLYFVISFILAIIGSFLRTTSGLYYKHKTIVNDNSSVVNKLEALLTDDARGIIYNRRKFIIQATGVNFNNIL